VTREASRALRVRRERSTRVSTRASSASCCRRLSVRWSEYPLRLLLRVANARLTWASASIQLALGADACHTDCVCEMCVCLRARWCRWWSHVYRRPTTVRCASCPASGLARRWCRGVGVGVRFASAWSLCCDVSFLSFVAVVRSTSLVRSWASLAPRRRPRASPAASSLAGGLEPRRRPRASPAASSAPHRRDRPRRQLHPPSSLTQHEKRRSNTDRRRSNAKRRAIDMVNNIDRCGS
jgi:hypothetical protein